MALRPGLPCAGQPVPVKMHRGGSSVLMIDMRGRLHEKVPDLPCAAM